MNSSLAAPKTPPPSPPPNSPQILAFLPTIARAGGRGFLMLILRANIAASAVANFGLTQLMPTSLLSCNPGEICPEIVSEPASAIASAGQVSLSLTSPGAGGATSGTVQFLILANTAFPMQESVNSSEPPAPANGNSKRGNLGTSVSVSPSTDFGGIDNACATRAANILPTDTSGKQIVGTMTRILQETVLQNCGPASTVIVSVDQNGVPGQADSSNPTVVAGKIAFTSGAGLLPNVSGLQVYAAGPCLCPEGTALSPWYRRVRMAIPPGGILPPWRRPGHSPPSRPPHPVLRRRKFFLRIHFSSGLSGDPCRTRGGRALVVPR